MRIFYDTEFLEQGPNHPIELISLGMVREDGKTLYLVNMEFNPNKFNDHPWLFKNVKPYLPVVNVGSEIYWQANHPDIRTRAEIRDAVRRFVLEVDYPELWAWYGAYDHVVLTQLFGTFVDLPSTFPMFTHDFMQTIDKTTFTVSQNKNKHNALADALWLAFEYERFHGLG